MAKPATRAQLKEYCLRKLGKPVIEINGDDDQVEDRVIAYSLHLTPDLEDNGGGSLDLFEAGQEGKSKLVKKVFHDLSDSILIFKSFNCQV